MSIENNLTSIAESLRKIADCLTAMTGTQQAPTAPPQAPAIPPQAPAMPQTYQPYQQAPQAPQMPPVPQAPPVPQSAQVLPMPGLPQQTQHGYPPAPLTTPADVMNYCVQKYKTLGPAKGAMLQAILTELGHANLNTLRPDQYAEFYSKAEAIAL